MKSIPIESIDDVCPECSDPETEFCFGDPTQDFKSLNMELHCSHCGAITELTYTLFSAHAGAKSDDLTEEGIANA